MPFEAFKSVWIGGLPEGVTEEDLMNMGQQVGAPTDVMLQKNKTSARITFTTEEEAQEAVRTLGGATLGEATLQCDRWSNQGNGPKGNGGDPLGQRGPRPSPYQQAEWRANANRPGASGAKGGAQGEHPPGSWVCTGCNNVNWPKRSTCKMCSSPKEQVDGGAPQGANLGVAPQYAPQFGVKDDSHGEHPAGSWVCTSCGNVNWPLRSTCKKCCSPKEQVDGGAPQGGNSGSFGKGFGKSSGSSGSFGKGSGVGRLGVINKFRDKSTPMMEKFAMFLQFMEMVEGSEDGGLGSSPGKGKGFGKGFGKSFGKGKDNTGVKDWKFFKPDCAVWLNNVPEAATHMDLHTLGKQAGDAKFAKKMANGQAWIVFGSPEDVPKAVTALNGAQIGETIIQADRWE